MLFWENRPAQRLAKPKIFNLEVRRKKIINNGINNSCLKNNLSKKLWWSDLINKVSKEIHSGAKNHSHYLILFIGNLASKEGGAGTAANGGDVEMNGDEADPEANETTAEALSSFLRGFTYLRLMEKGETYLSSLKNEQEKQRAVRGTMALDCLQNKRAQKRFN